MGAAGGPPRGVHIIYHGADALLIRQDSFPDREVTLTVHEETQHTYPFSRPSRDSVDVRRPGESCI